MEENTHLQYIMLLLFQERSKCNWTQKTICAVCVEGTVTDQMCQKWFVKFCAGDFSLDDAPRLARIVEVDGDQIKTLIIIPRGKQLTYSKYWYPNQ